MLNPVIFADFNTGTGIANIDLPQLHFSIHSPTKNLIQYLGPDNCNLEVASVRCTVRSLCRLGDPAVQAVLPVASVRCTLSSVYPVTKCLSGRST